MTSPEKIRAARALLDMSQSELSEISGLSIPTIKRAESTTGSIAASATAIESITKALETNGIEFIEEGAASLKGGGGVRLKRARPSK